MPTRSRRTPNKAVPSLSDWKHSAIQDVELSSGAGMVKQRPGTLPDAIRGGRIPNPLRGIAMKVEYEGIDPKELDPDELAAYEDFKDWYVADTVQEPALTPEDVRELPAGDREQLWLNAVHAFQGQLADLLGSVMDLRTFRDGAGRTGASADGDGAREAAE